MQSDQWVKRTFGACVGLGFLLLGIFSIFGGDETLSEASRDRAFGFGVTLVIAGVLAILVSLTVKNLNDIWCRHPRSWWGRRENRS